MRRRLKRENSTKLCVRYPRWKYFEHTYIPHKISQNYNFFSKIGEKVANKTRNRSKNNFLVYRFNIKINPKSTFLNPVEKYEIKQINALKKSSRNSFSNNNVRNFLKELSLINSLKLVCDLLLVLFLLFKNRWYYFTLYIR